MPPSPGVIVWASKHACLNVFKLGSMHRAQHSNDARKEMPKLPWNQPRHAVSGAAQSEPQCAAFVECTPPTRSAMQNLSFFRTCQDSGNGCGRPVLLRLDRRPSGLSCLTVAGGTRRKRVGAYSLLFSGLFFLQFYIQRCFTVMRKRECVRARGLFLPTIRVKSWGAPWSQAWGQRKGES